MSNSVFLHLKRFWTYPNGETVDLYEEIKSGRKTSEWREPTNYWITRLLLEPQPKHACFVVGYPKNNLPRLEADISLIFYHVFDNQIEIQFENVKETV